MDANVHIDLYENYLNIKMEARLFSKKHLLQKSPLASKLCELLAKARVPPVVC